MPVTEKKPFSTQSLTQPLLAQETANDSPIGTGVNLLRQKNFLMNHCPSICSFI